MQYATYSAAELAQDTYFQRWILEQDHSVDLFWTNWLLEHPDKKPVVEEAKRMVVLLGFDQNYERNQHFAEVWNEVSAQTIDRKPQLMKYAALWIGVLLVSGIAFFWLRPSGNYTYRTLAQQESFTLPDGSTVALNANSTISYRVDRSGNREVDLVGEGFFDVVKQRTADDRKSEIFGSNQNRSGRSAGHILWSISEKPENAGCVSQWCSKSISFRTTIGSVRARRVRRSYQHTYSITKEGGGRSAIFFLG